MFFAGSASYKMLEEMLTKPRLITAIRKLSQYHQTSGLEAKHVWTTYSLQKTPIILIIH